MRQHFRELPDFLYAVAHKLDFYAGLGVGIIFAIVAYLTSMPAGTVATFSISIAAVALLFAAYGVYHEERTMRTEREQKTVVRASLTSQQINHPPVPGKFTLRVGVEWQIWTDQDLSTDQLGLNLIYTYNKQWWKFWKPSRVPVVGIPPKGADSTSYRRLIPAGSGATQPLTDRAIFEYEGDRPSGQESGWLLELVLKTGMSPNTYRVPIFIDWDEINSRGTNPPQ